MKPEIIFVSGHLDLTEEEFQRYYVPLISPTNSFVVGDARGADLLFQRYAKTMNLKVTLFHMFDQPRNRIGDFPLVGGFTSDEERDKAMTEISSQDIAWVRPGRETSGTAKNLKRRSLTK